MLTMPMEIKSESELAPQTPSANEPDRYFLHNPWCQVLLGATVVTLSRGTLNALNAVGAYGTGDVRIATIVNLCSGTTFATLSWMSGTWVNKIGFRLSSLMGSLITSMLLVVLYLHTVASLISSQWVWVCGLLDGIGSGLIWTAVSTIAVLYPPDHRKGLASTLLFVIFSTGAALGGLFAFMLNKTTASEDTDTSSAISAGPYKFLISLTFLGVLLSLLIMKLEDIKHAKTSLSFVHLMNSFEGSREFQSPYSSEAPSQTRQRSLVNSFKILDDIAATSHRNEFRDLIATFKDRTLRLLLVFAFASLFHQTYLFNGVNFTMFNIRTRGLNCFFYWSGRIPAGILHGQLVDNVALSSRVRGAHVFALLLLQLVLAQGLVLFFVDFNSTGRYDVTNDARRSAFVFTCFFLYGGLDTISQSFALWLFSILGRERPSRVPHYVAVYRSFQGIGCTLAWWLDLNGAATYQQQYIITALGWLIAMPGLIKAIKQLPSDDGSSVKL